TLAQRSDLQSEILGRRLAEEADAENSLRRLCLGGSCAEHRQDTDDRESAKNAPEPVREPIAAVHVRSPLGVPMPRVRLADCAPVHESGQAFHFGGGWHGGRRRWCTSAPAVYQTKLGVQSLWRRTPYAY